MAIPMPAEDIIAGIAHLVVRVDAGKGAAPFAAVSHGPALDCRAQARLILEFRVIMYAIIHIPFEIVADAVQESFFSCLIAFRLAVALSKAERE